MSTLRYALLCALHLDPLTGYEIVQRMRRPIGYYWTAQQSQIYPELARLTEDGLIEHDTAAGPGPHDRKTHRLTEAGRAELARWLVEPPHRRPPKDELVLKTFALAAADQESMRNLYRAERDRHQEQLDDYLAQQRTAEARGDDAPQSPRFGAYATLRLGIAAERTMVEWCDWLVSQLDR